MSIAKKTAAPVHNEASLGRLVPAAPELSGAGMTKKRKRLAKAFTRPLDKKLKEVERVREKISIPAPEHRQLLELKQRLAGQGIAVKKGELLCAGLRLLAKRDDADFQAALAKLSAIG